MMSHEDLPATARAILDSNRYMVLSTADDGGRPWASPVFYSVKDYRELFWISSPETTHSSNIAVRPNVSIVIFDSQVNVGGGSSTAVYMSATANELEDGDIPPALENYPGPAERGGREITFDDVRPPSPYRIYRAAVSAAWMLCPRESGAPCAQHGRNFDHRTEVRL